MIINLNEVKMKKKKEKLEKVVEESIKVMSSGYPWRDSKGHYHKVSFRISDECFALDAYVAELTQQIYKSNAERDRVAYVIGKMMMAYAFADSDDPVVKELMEGQESLIMYEEEQKIKSEIEVKKDRRDKTDNEKLKKRFEKEIKQLRKKLKKMGVKI